MSYSAADVASVAVTDGSSSTSASKSLNCFSAGGSATTCVLYGLTPNAIANGTIANVAVQLQSSSTATTIPVSVSNVSATDATGSSVAATGSGGAITRSAVASALSAIACSPAAVTGGSPSSCTVTLTKAAAVAENAQLSSNSAAVVVPSSVSFAAGATNASFAVATKSVTSSTAALIMASLSGSSKSANLQVNAAPLWSVSGSAGAAPNAVGVTIFIHSYSTLTDSTVLTGSNGSFTASGLANGMYLITPSKTGFSFSPASRTVTISNASIVGQNFSIAPSATWSLSGTAAAGATIAVRSSATSQTQVVTASSTGAYVASGLANGSYVVTPTKTGYAFTPVNRTVTISNGNVAGVNFASGAVGVTPTIATDVIISADQGRANHNVSTRTFSTHSGNQLLLAFVTADSVSSPNVTVNRVLGAGLVWTLVSRTNRQQGTAEIWRAFAPATLSTVAVSATLSQSVVSSLTVMSFTGVSTSGVGGSGAIGAIGSGSAANGAPSALLTTTRDQSLVVGVGDDFDQAIGRTPAANQVLVHQDLSPTGDTYWVQMLRSTVPLKGTQVMISDSAPSTDQYNMSVCEILPAGSN